MSELKDLTWAVQDSVRAPAFLTLTYRARRRRKRRAAVAVLAAAAVMLGVVLPISRIENLPVAAQTTYPSGNGVTFSGGSDAPGEQLVSNPEAGIDSLAVIDRNRWMSVWAVCLPSCKYSAVVKWDGVKVALPVRSRPYEILRRGDELILVGGPALGTEDDRSWADSFLVRCTEAGPVRTPLRYARPSQTFAPKDEVLSRGLTPGTVDVVNVEKSTLRRLRPDGIRFPASPLRDDSGRWWMVDDIGGSRILWTDDGKTWARTELDSSMAAGFLAVSRNGRTIMAGSRQATPSGPGRLGLLKMSTDAGASWRTIALPKTLFTEGSAAFSDGSALLLGHDYEGWNNHFYRVHDGKAATASGRRHLGRTATDVAPGRAQRRRHPGQRHHAEPDQSGDPRGGLNRRSSRQHRPWGDLDQVRTPLGAGLDQQLQQRGAFGGSQGAN